MCGVERMKGSPEIAREKVKNDRRKKKMSSDHGGTEIR